MVVLDQAPYHTMLDPQYRNPTTASRKGADIIEWLFQRGVPELTDGTSFEKKKKNELLDLSKQYHYPKTYLLDRIAKEMRSDKVKLLWLPVAHFELNPIELIWAYVKRRVPRENKILKIGDVHALCQGTMADLPSTLWPNCIKHAQKIEDEYRGHQYEIVEAIGPLIVINIGDDSDSDSEDFDEDDAESDDDVDIREDMDHGMNDTS